MNGATPCCPTAASAITISAPSATPCITAGRSTNQRSARCQKSRGTAWIATAPTVSATSTGVTSGDGPPAPIWPRTPNAVPRSGARKNTHARQTMLKVTSQASQRGRWTRG